MAITPWPPVLGREVQADGFIGRLGSLVNQPAEELARRIGYRSDRLKDGWWLLLLIEAVAPGDFEFAGYSHFSGGRIGHPSLGDARPKAEDAFRAEVRPDFYDQQKMATAASFTTIGTGRGAKVVPRDPGPDSYPPGSGVPQFRLLKPKRFLVVADIPAGHRYVGGGAGNWIEPKPLHGLGLAGTGA